MVVYIVMMNVFLFSIVGMLIAILVIGFYAAGAAPSTISSMIEQSMPEDMIKKLVSDSFKQAVQSDEFVSLISTLLAGSGGCSSNSEATGDTGSTDSNTKPKESGETCKGVQDQTTCKNIKTSCSTLNRCISTRNDTICQSVGRKLYDVCSRI